MAHTKASLMRGAQHLVTTMKSFEPMLFDQKSLSVGDIFDGNPMFFMDGTSAIAIAFPERIETSRKAAHEKLQLIRWRQEIEAAMLPIGQAFHALLPGIPLTLEIEQGYSPGGYSADDNQNRYKLWLGATKEKRVGRHQNIIDTVLTRWKAPIIRLTQYLSAQTSSPAETVWYFAESSSLATPYGAIGRIQGVLNPAPTLLDAWKLYAFLNPDTSSTSTPRQERSAIVGAVRNPDSPLDANALLDHLNTLKTGVLAQEKNGPLGNISMPTGPHSLASESLNTQAQMLEDLLVTLQAEMKVTLRLDLTTQTVTAAFVDHPLANPTDIAAAQPLRAAIETAATVFCQDLGAYVQQLHPKMRTGKITIAMGSTQTTIGIKTTWTYVMDGYRGQFNASAVENLVYVAAMLNAVDVTEDTNLYLLRHRQPVYGFVNQKDTCVLISGSNPAHALWCYTAPSNTAKLSDGPCDLFILDPAPRADVEATHKETLRAIEAVY